MSVRDVPPTSTVPTAPDAAALAAKERAAIRARRQPAHPGFRRTLLVALLLIAITGGLLTLAAAGIDFGLIGKSASMRGVLPIGDRSPTLRFGVVFPGAVHDYTFPGMKDTAVLITIMFPLGNGGPYKAVKFFGPDGSLLAYGANTSQNMTSLSYVLPTDGTYRVQITGTSNKAQGLYLLQAMGASITGGSIPR